MGGIDQDTRHGDQSRLLRSLIESYYTKRQSSRDDMVREKRRQFETIGPVRRLRLDNLQFTQLSPDRAVVLLR